mgnify:CR=1 FL=1
MKIKEVKNYLEYADPNIDIMILTREQYDKLIRKAKYFDRLKELIVDFYRNLHYN